MILDLLICWYSLGLFACGVNFAVGDIEGPRLPFWMCLLFPHAAILTLMIVSVAHVCRRLPALDTSKQYLWRKP